jgi:ArsR family transcriptional regulator, arsenate/arsenite/antimonite-responsive transcriptional repressor
VEIYELLKGLGDETRYKLVSHLISHNHCVKSLAKVLNISESAVSQQLKILRELGIVSGEKKGYYTHYYVHKEVIKDIADSLIGLSLIKQSKRDCNNKTTHINCFGKEEN